METVFQGTVLLAKTPKETVTAFKAEPQRLGSWRSFLILTVRVLGIEPTNQLGYPAPVFDEMGVP